MLQNLFSGCSMEQGKRICASQFNFVVRSNFFKCTFFLFGVCLCFINIHVRKHSTNIIYLPLPFLLAAYLECSFSEKFRVSTFALWC